MSSTGVVGSFFYPHRGEKDFLTGVASLARSQVGGSATKKKRRRVFKPQYEGEAPAAEDGGFQLFVDKTGRSHC